MPVRHLFLSIIINNLRQNFQNPNPMDLVIDLFSRVMYFLFFLYIVIIISNLRRNFQNPNPMGLVDLFRRVMHFLFFLLTVLVGQLNKITGPYLEPFKTLFAVAKLGNLLKHSDHFKTRAFSVIIQWLKIKVLRDRDERSAQDALSLLIKLANTEQRFFREQVVKVVGNMLQIAEKEILEDRTRHLVVEFVIMLLEPGMMRDLSELYISRLYAILLRMLSDVQWNEVRNQVEEAGQSSNYRFGEECLGRLVTTLGGNTIFQGVHRQLRSYFNADAREWQKHFAALVALAQIAKGRSMASVGELRDMMIMVVNSSRYPHVRNAATKAFRELSANLVEEINDPKLASNRLAAIRVTVGLSAHIEDAHWQDGYQRRVLPALSEAIKKDPNPNVTLAAINAAVQLSVHLNAAPDLEAEYQTLVLPALSEAICDFKYPQFQDAFAMINISRNYPQLSPCETVGTLLKEHALSQLEILKGENIAWHQPRITAIRRLVTLFEAELPPDTWNATFNSLSPVQQAECQSILVPLFLLDG